MNKQFIYKGYKCFIKEMDLYGIPPFHNGYVEIPRGHFLYGTNYQDGSFPDLEVNGGITYSESFLEELEDSWFIGFDTTHSENIKAPETQTSEFVEEELKKLVEQIIEIDTSNKTTGATEYVVVGDYTLETFYGDDVDGILHAIKDLAENKKGVKVFKIKKGGARDIKPYDTELIFELYEQTI